MTVSLTEKRSESIKQACCQIRPGHNIRIRDLASVIGKIVASFPGVLWGPLYYRMLERDKILALRANAGNFDKKCTLSDEAKNELDWWIANVEKSCYPVEKTKPDIILKTDASSIGWGADCDGISTGGHWNSVEKEMNINALEILAIFFGLKSFQHLLSNKHVRVRSDNNCAVSYVNNMGGSHSMVCNDLAFKVWSWCREQSVWISVVYIPGVDNIIADAESRKTNDDTEWKLDPIVFQKLTEKWDPFEIDLFASRLNYQLKPFVSWRPDPESTFCDAFSLPWDSWFIYAFPPFSIIQRVLLKWKGDQAEGVMIVPHWPTAFWYPQLLRLLVDCPILLPKGRRLLQLQDRNRIHPLSKKLDLLACRLSGNPSRNKMFRDNLRKSSLLPGDSPHKDSTPRTFVAGKLSVLQGVLIPFMHL